MNLKFKLIVTLDDIELQTLEQTYAHNASCPDMSTIENVCESFIRTAMPEVEGRLLETAQAEQVLDAGLKKTELVR